MYAHTEDTFLVLAGWFFYYDNNGSMIFLNDCQHTQFNCVYNPNYISDVIS